MHRSTDQSWSHGYGEAPLPCGCRRCPVCVRACEKPRVFLWGCVGLGRECFGYAKAPWGVCSEGLPVRVMRRRATLPHPVGCSTIAVPGLSFRVRKGTGRHTWAMATAKTTTDGPDPQRGPRPAKRENHPRAATGACRDGPGTGQRTRTPFRDHRNNAPCRQQSRSSKDADPPPHKGGGMGCCVAVAR